jgi:soluble lytic murein transglycosylase
MRGALNTLSRLNAARLISLSAAIFVFGLHHASAQQTNAPTGGTGAGPTPPLTAQRGGPAGDDVAYAVPRNAPAGNVEIVLPAPLSPGAVAMYDRIYAAQLDRDYIEADRLIGRLTDTTLLGSVLAARYLSPSYHPSVTDLTSWYSAYGDQPDAPAIWRLLSLHEPRAQLPAAPQLSLLPEDQLSAGNRPPSLIPDSATWRSAFVRGIASWSRGDIAGAGKSFDRLAQMGGISQDDRAASDFWAARAALRLLHPDEYLGWLHQAAALNTTFYGLLAGRLLGEGLGPTGIAATLSEADVTAVDATANGHLAFALLQVGNREDAAEALRTLWPHMQADPDFGRSVMAVAARAGLVDVTIGIADHLPGPGVEIAGAKLPMPPLHPAGGFTVDPSLVYALARTESGFNPAALSGCGARGLMQLMPVTAGFIKRVTGVTGRLDNPDQNLALGQAYVKYLGDQPGIDGNLLAVLASYNAGPNAAAAWYGALQDDSDPLVFIESIPNNQTRHFVHQVLADSWLYAEEIGLRPQSLDALAQGNFPQLSLNIADSAAN